jgi:hypothetical protein
MDSNFAMNFIVMVIVVAVVFLFMLNHITKPKKEDNDTSVNSNTKAEPPQAVPTNDAKGNTYAGKARAESHDEARDKSSDSVVDTVITAAVVADVLLDDDCEESNKPTQTNSYEDNSNNSTVEVRTETNTNTDTSDYSSSSSGGGDW